MSCSEPRPSYLELYRTGELERRCVELESRLRSCTLCPRCCRVNRLQGERGWCRSGTTVGLRAALPHFGEEPPLVGTGGAGTLFFSHCALRCVYCQNYQISQGAVEPADAISVEELADRMFGLQAKGCSNLDWVSPTHWIGQIVRALLLAVPKGLHLPVIYNTHGYESVETLRLLEGIVSIYLPDIKYGSDEVALRYSSVEDYVQHNRTALREMYRQVGDLELDEKGVAVRGLVVRHLVLPNDLAQTRSCLQFLAGELSPSVTVSLMAQYAPVHRAHQYPELNRTLSAQEYGEAVEWMEKLGLEKGWVQEAASPQTYRPDFERLDPFGTTT